MPDIDDPSQAAENCFVAAGIYAGFVLATSICILRTNKRQRDARTELEWGSGKEATGIASNSRFVGGYGR